MICWCEFAPVVFRVVRDEPVALFQSLGDLLRLNLGRCPRLSYLGHSALQVGFALIRAIRVKTQRRLRLALNSSICGSLKKS